MHSIPHLQSLILKKIDGFCRVNGEEEILQPVNYLMQIGGKRMRPVLALMAANLFTDDLDEVVYPALAIEVFHNFTLMHDDIMDNAPLRRGQQTVHEKWNVNTAILSGDAMMIQAYQLICKAPDNVLKQVLSIFSKTALEVCVGQQRDMQFEKRDNVSIAEYTDMIRLKTSVLLAGAMQVGAIIAHANEEDQKHMYSFGENLGIAFQLWDDYLDAFGDEAKVGKLKGGDIVSDKKTFLLIKAKELANATQRATLNQYVGQKTNLEEKVNAVLEVFQQLNLPKLLESEMDYYYQKAIMSLNLVSVSDERKQPLREFAQGIMVREH